MKDIQKDSTAEAKPLSDAEILVAQHMHDRGGTDWTTANGLDWNEILEKASPNPDQSDRGSADNMIRYEFDDGSAIICYGSFRDYGMPLPHTTDSCFCLSETGHTDDCHNRPAAS